MEFKEMLKQLKAGIKVKRKCWSRDHTYLAVKGCEIVNSVGHNIGCLSFEDFEVTDWEIYEDKEEKWVKDKLKRIQAILEEG